MLSMKKILPSSPSSISGGLWCSDDSSPGTLSLSGPVAGPLSSLSKLTGCPYNECR